MTRIVVPVVALYVVQPVEMRSTLAPSTLSMATVCGYPFVRYVEGVGVRGAFL